MRHASFVMHTAYGVLHMACCFQLQSALSVVSR